MAYSGALHVNEEEELVRAQHDMKRWKYQGDQLIMIISFIIFISALIKIFHIFFLLQLWSMKVFSIIELSFFEIFSKYKIEEFDIAFSAFSI